MNEQQPVEVAAVEQTATASPERRPGLLRKLWRELAPIIVLAGVLLAARSSIANHYVVPTGSMEYSVLPGDRVLVDQTAYTLRAPFLGMPLVHVDEPERGDVVVFESPENGELLVKRVVAIGGDSVALRDGWLTVNGHPAAVHDPSGPTEVIGQHVAHLNLHHGGGPDLAPFRIPEGEVLLIGDARGNSRDGRWFGTVSSHELIGRAIAVFYRQGEGFVWNPL